MVNNEPSCIYSADIDHLIGVDEEKIQRSSALFLLKLKEHRRISQVGIDDIVQGATGLFYQVSDRLQAGIRAKLAEADIDFEAIHGLDDVFNDLPNPFCGIETSYLQENYYRQSLGLVVSMICVFTVNPSWTTPIITLHKSHIFSTNRPLRFNPMGAFIERPGRDHNMSALKISLL